MHISLTIHGSDTIREGHRSQTALQPQSNDWQWRTQEFFSGWGVQQIQLRTEDREDGDLVAVAP